MKLGQWKVVESGAVCTILKAKGTNMCVNADAEQIDFEVKLTAYAKSHGLRFPTGLSIRR